MRKILLLVLSIFSFLTAFAQVDTEFWFAVPYLSTHSQNAEYHLVMFSSGSAANVTISMPANSSFSPIVTTIAKNGSKDLIIAADYATAQSQFAVPYDVISSKAICVSSDTKIYCYFHITHNNGEVYTLKGQKAKGTDFRVLSQSSMVNGKRTQYTDPYHSVEILATEDNTHVTITPTKNIGTACVSTPISITLNRGQTYAIRACSQDAIDHLFGTRITSDKAIIVNSTDDSVLATGGTGRDLVADQLTPIDLWGTEYIAMGHQIAWENLSITALENNTTVSLSNGSSITLNQGETQSVSMASQEVMYIHSNKVVGVFQVTGFQQESGGTNLPCLECTGSRVVKYKRLAMSLMTYVQIVTRTENISHFLLNGSVIPSSNFNNVAGTGGKYCYAIINVTDIVPTSSLVSVECTSGLFQMGVLDVDAADITKPTSATSCTYGYFSDYGTAHEYDEYATFAEGTTYTWKNHFLPGTTTPMTFTAEGVYTDNQLTDRNGCDSICILHLSKIPYPDNVADIECVVPPIPSDFEMKELYQAQEAISVSTPLVADIDGDGQTEIIASSWVGGSPKFHANRINIYDGRNGTLERSITTPVYNLCGQPLAIADVDRDGKGEMFLLASDMYIYAYNWQGTQIWKSSFTLSDRFMPAVADVNNDGQPELVCGKYIFKPTDGTLLLELTLNPDGMGFGAPNGIASTKGYYSYYMPALTDIDGDGSLELCAGTTIYKLNILNPNGTSGNSFSVLRTANTIGAYTDWNYDGQTFVVDFDNDGDEDICVIGCNHDVTDNGSPYYIDLYIWDGQTSNIIGYARETSLGHNNGGTWCAASMPFAGDLNGDGYPEILFSMYETAMFAYTYDNSQPNGTRRMHKHVPFAETVGFTVFDFNMDGKSEIVYRGMDELFVADGTTLNYLCTPISIHSQTLTEYPVVADVNGDGVAEIIIANSSDRTVYVGWMSVFGEAKSGAWSSARPVWNQWAYNSVNINEDLTVPQNQYDVATLFPNGTKPYNSFLAQKPIIDKQGDIFVPAADAAVTSCTSEVINDSVNITISFCNNGDANLIAPYEIAVYQNEYRGRVVQVDTVKQTLTINGCTTATIKVPALSVCQAAVDNSFVIAINDDGHGIAQHGNQQAECDTTNNRTSIVLPPNLRRDTTYVNIIIEQGQKYTFNGHDYTTDTQDTATFTAASGCDSVCILDLKVIPYPENVTDVPCSVDPPSNVWSIHLSDVSTETSINHCSTPIVGDVDDDGNVEILVPMMAASNKFSKLGIYDYKAKLKRMIDIPTCSEFIHVAIAKVQTGVNTYQTLIFFLAYDKYLYAYTANGTQVWKSNLPYSSHDGENAVIASLSLADFNHDGWAELYLGSEIYDAATGIRLCKHNGNRGFANRTWKEHRRSYQSVAADVVGDYGLELIAGNQVWHPTINSRTDESQNTITKVAEVPSSLMKMEDNSSIPYTDGHTLFADMDADGLLDIVVMTIDRANRIIYVYIWNPRNNTIIGTKKITNAAEFGTPNIGDIDNDGNLELNFIIGTYDGETTDTNDKIFSIKYNKSTHAFEVFWTLHHDDASGATGLTLFDFNQDGTQEIVYRDCENLRIINGSKKHHITGAPVATAYDMATISCTSGTGIEYPVIADVDADGEAEIIVTGSGYRLLVYESDLEPWAPARKVWNQFAYNITNTNEDLTIPVYQFNNAHKFTDASSKVRQPYNNFLSQVTSINSQGVPYVASADVATTTASAPSFANDSVSFDVSYCNQGDLQLNAPYSITTYAKSYRGTVLHIDTIYDVLSIGDCTQKTIKFPVTALCADASINKLLIAINDDGKGIAQHGNQQAECDTTNNTLSITIPNIHTDTTHFNSVICATELPYTHPETGIVFPIGFSKPDSCITETNQFGCDSVVQVKITINPTLYGDTTVIIHGETTPYIWWGNPYSSSGNYPRTFQSKVTGCDSIVTLHLMYYPYPDNVDVVNCSAPLENNDWTIKTSYSSEEIMSPLVIPLVGDINDDGVNEILCFAPNSTHKYFGATQINIINGVTHNIIDQININGVVPTESAGIYGIVKLPNRHTILVVVITGKKILGYDLCASHTNPIWTKSIPYNMVNINFADFNNDGYPEVYCGNYIFDVETGNLLAHGGTNSGKSFAHKNETGLSLSTDDYMHAPFAADMDEDGKLELVAGNEIYKVSITNRTGESGNSISLLKSIAPPTGVPTDGHTQVADFNLDGHLDVLISNKPQTTNTNVYYYVWDVYNNTTSQPIIIPNVDGVERGKSFPLIADINADGELEIIVQSDTYHTYDKVQAYKYNIAGNNFTHLWNLTVDEDSYSNTMSAFDFNHDGINELILTDQTTIKILNGSGKSHITGNDTVNIYAMSSFSFGECTIMQYPVVVDVDKDGTADIVAIGRYGSGHTYKGSLNIFTSAGKPWAPARSVWNQYMYNVFNINEDLTIPTYHYSNAKSFTDPDDPTIIRRPYNNFFQQSTTIDQYGRYVNRAADVAVTSVTQAYTETEWSLTPSYCNNGERELLAPYKITIYANSYHGDVIATETVNQTLPVGDCVQPTLQIPSSVLCTDSTIHKLVIAVNDGGLGVAQHGNQQAECDTTNNTIVVILPKVQSDTTVYTPVICATELPYTHPETGIVFPIGFSKPDSCETHTNQFGCDSVVQVKITINPTLYGDTTVTIAEGQPFTWHGVDYSTDGHYPYTYTSKVTGCDSIVTLHLTHVPYPDNIVNVSCEVPPTATNFDMIEIYKCDSIHPMTTPFVADIDGDGITEIISCKWPETRAVFGSDGFVVIDGRNGKRKYTINTAQYCIAGQSMIIADVNKDTKCEIMLQDIDTYAYGYSYNGTLLWKSTFALGAKYIPQLCDFNHDGQPELVFGCYIFNPLTGALLHKINYQNTGKGWGAPHGVSQTPGEKYLQGYYMNAVSDIDNDGNVEICAGNTIYCVNLTNFVDSVGNRSYILRQAQNLSSVQEYDGQTFVVDFDNDGDLDVCVLGLSHEMADSYPNPMVSVYVWDGQTDNIVSHTQFASTGAEPGDHTWTGPSIPYCGDLDGDGLSEITFSIKNMGMMSYKYSSTASNHISQLHNYAPFSETCGYGVFDFNKDGKSEIVYRDEYTLSIVDGTTLSPLCTPITAYSGTITEYPVVADVNGDGSAEIIVNRALYDWNTRQKVLDDIRGWTSVYGSSISGAWTSARPVWNQWAYTSTAINDDLTVPEYQFNLATQFPNGTKPFNTFLSQVPIIDPQGDIFVPAADAIVTGCTHDIKNDSIELTLSYCNNGDAILVAPFEVTVYKNAYRNTVLWVDTIREELRMPNCSSFSFKIPNDLLCPVQDLSTLLVAINDDGHGIAQHGNQQAECDTTNNTIVVNIPKFQSDTTRFYPVICSSELPYTHAISGIVFPVGFTSGKDSCVTKTNIYGCDSVTQVTLTINPILYGDTAATFCNGHPFKWHGVDYPTGGDYQYTYTSEVTGCDSIVTLHLTQLEPTDSVENVTICEGETHYWHGNPYTSTVDITETITNAAGCDSVCTLHLKVNPKLSGDTAATFCKGKSFTWHGVDYSTAGDYPYTYTSKVTGCDSIVTLHLSQLEPTDSIENVTICEGETHYWHGNPYTTTTDITETITNAAGCDSVCTLHLKVNPKLTGDTAATFCNGHPFTWHGVDYPTAGDYLYTYTSKVTGCDSIVTLHLTQLEPTDSIEYATICEGDTYTWHGHTYTSSIDITETIDNAAGCDSVCTLHLIVNPKLYGDTAMTVCDTLLPVAWRGQTISSAGPYYHTLTGSNGCDSIVTLTVTVETCLPPVPPTPTCDTLQASLIVPDICADDDSMYIDITYTDGLPVSYNVTFGSDAVAQGFQASYSGNVRITSATTATIAIAIPNDPNDRQKYPRPNTYKINISLTDTCDATQTWSEEFLIHYPSWLTLQRWNDVISMYNERYNGGYVFSTIRWYHEGSLLESHGDHDGYIYERPHLIYGEAYWAELTRADDGVTITTCPIYPVPMTDSTKMDDVTDPYIIVTPTVVTPSNPTVTVKTNICGEYYVYYVDGHLLDKQNFCPKDNHTFTIDIDPCYVRTGLYILVFYGEEGTIKAVKLLVEP